MDHSAFSGLVTGTIAAEAARGCIPPTRRGIRRFRGEFAFVLRPSVPRAKRSRCRAPRRRARRRPATPSHLRGTPRFHPLPTHGRPWVPSATLLPATPSRHRGRPSVASRQRDQPAAFEGGNGWGPTPSKGAVGPSRGAVALAAATPYRDRHRRLAGPPEHRPLPTGPASCLAGRPRGVPRCIPAPSARDPCRSPLRGTGRWGVRWGPDRIGRQTCRRHRREGRSARCGNYQRTKLTGHHQRRNRLSRRELFFGEVTESVTGYCVSR